MYVFACALSTRTKGETAWVKLVAQHCDTTKNLKSGGNTFSISARDGAQHGIGSDRAEGAIIPLPSLQHAYQSIRRDPTETTLETFLKNHWKAQTFIAVLCCIMLRKLVGILHTFILTSWQKRQRSSEGAELYNRHPLRHDTDVSKCFYSWDVYLFRLGFHPHLMRGS